MARETLAGLRTQLNNERIRANYELGRADVAEAELKQLKTAVAVKVRELTSEHGWCDEATEAMREVGIEPVKRRVKFEVEMSIEVEMDVDHISVSTLDGFVQVRDLNSIERERLAGWVENTAVVYDAANEAVGQLLGSLELDGDVSNVVVDENPSVEIKNLRDAE